MSKKRHHEKRRPSGSRENAVAQRTALPWQKWAGKAAVALVFLLIAVWAAGHFWPQTPRTRAGGLADTAGTNSAPTASKGSSTNLTGLAAERQKESVAAELNRAANELLKAGDPAGAVRAYRQAIAQTPNDEDLHFNLGIAYTRIGDLTNAEAEYREALRLLPDYPEVHNNLGNLLMRAGRLSEAEGHFTEAVKQMPEYAQAHNNLGTLRQRQKMTNEALLCFQKAVELDTNNWEAHFNLASTYLQRNEREKGIEQLKETLRINPSFEMGQRMLQKALGQAQTP